MIREIEDIKKRLSEIANELTALQRRGAEIQDLISRTDRLGIKIPDDFYIHKKRNEDKIDCLWKEHEKKVAEIWDIRSKCDNEWQKVSWSPEARKCIKCGKIETL